MTMNDTLGTNLPKPLRILFLLNGVTEGLPSGLPLLSLINDRVRIPVAYIPIYYAVAFLPYSLKPFYAVLTRSVYYQTHRLLISNFLGSALTFILTAFLSANAILPCFTLAFFRGFFTSFAEFIVGNTLISNAKMEGGWCDDHDTKKERQRILLSSYQSQAATSRNIGTFLAQSFVFLNLWNKIQIPSEEDDGDSVEGLDESWITFIFLLTSFLPLTAAVCAIYFQVGKQPSRKIEDYATPFTKNEILSFTYLWSVFRREVMSLILFQSIMVVIALRTIIVEYSSNTAWYFMLLTLFGSFSFALWGLYHKRPSNILEGSYEHLYRIGFYLILRHLMPTTPGIQSSFSYWLLRSYPFCYQIMGLMNSVISIISSWSYGKYISTQFACISGIKKVVVATTVALSIMALLFNMPFIYYFRSHSDDWDWIMMILYILYQLIDSFVRELFFLPSVILASNSTVKEDAYAQVLAGENIDEIQDDMGHTEETHELELTHSLSQKETCDENINDALTYGLMLGCLNFGDQVGDLASVPIIQALGIERDHNWKNMEWFVLICSMLSVVSLVFLRILKLK